MKPHGTWIRGCVLTAILIALPLSVRWLRLTSLLPAEGSHSKGSANAPIEIVEFSDFQCPACARVQPHLADLLKRFPGKVRVTFYHFPLRGHKWAMPAHLSAECAARQGKFWKYHDKLYQEQATWSAAEDPSELLLRYADGAGLNMTQFVSCLRDPATEQVLMAGRKAGEKRAVQSTPALFVREKLFVGDVQFREEGFPYIESLARGGDQ